MRVRYFRYFWYVIRHKYYVMIECFKYKLIWQGIVHDLSKLLPSEFFPYADYFYGKKGEDIKKGRDETGYYQIGDTIDDKFNFAWLLHQKRNKHHWQWWILPFDDGGEKVFPMPFCDMIEMLCDWRGAGKAQGTPDTLAWYEKNNSKMRLHPTTRQLVENMLNQGGNNGQKTKKRSN